MSQAIRERQLFLEGVWEGSEPWATVTSPMSGEPVARVAQASVAQVQRALAFAEGGRRRLAALSTGERRGVLDRIAQGLRARAEEVAALITQEAGKPIAASRVEVQRCLEVFTLASAELSRFGGEVVPVDLLASAKGAQAIVRRFPAGVVVGIVPFNFPLNLGAHKVAPALAVGAPIIVKPPPQAPSAMLVLAELAKAAGAEPAALQVLPCGNAEAELLATDSRVRVMSFTGSAKVGWHLKGKVAGKAVLELGGNAGAIVCKDADLSLAAERLAKGAFTYSGQVCIRAQRLVIDAVVWDAFVPKLVEQVKRLKVGDPAQDDTVLGPVIDDRAADRIEAWVNEAVGQGARVLLRGARAGRLLGPTLLTDVPRSAKASCEEIFGPVLVLEQVQGFDAAVQAVNDGVYGLQAAVFTHDVRLVRRAHQELEVGGVILNDAPTFRSDAMPYGGVKQSGLSREGLASAMADFTEERVLVDRTP